MFPVFFLVRSIETQCANRGLPPAYCITGDSDFRAISIDVSGWREVTYNQVVLKTRFGADTYFRLLQECQGGAKVLFPPWTFHAGSLCSQCSTKCANSEGDETCARRGYMAGALFSEALPEGCICNNNNNGGASNLARIISSEGGKYSCQYDGITEDCKQVLH